MGMKVNVELKITNELILKTCKYVVLWEVSENVFYNAPLSKIRRVDFFCINTNENSARKNQGRESQKLSLSSSRQLFHSFLHCVTSLCIICVYVY
jgi:hypothetical protein